MIILKGTKTIIDFNNNYYLKIINNDNDLPLDVTNIENLKLINIVKKESFLLKIDFNKFNKKRYKRLLKRLFFIKKKGIKFKMKDILLLDVFFNPLQKYFIRLFTPKDKIMKRLMIL